MQSLSDIPPSIYLFSCPNCGRSISTYRLLLGSVCNICLEDDKEYKNIGDLIKDIEKQGNLIKLKDIQRVLDDYESFVSIFKRLLGFPPFGPQKSWIYRLLSGESFAIIAPPGLGKTTFGLISSIYLYLRGKKSILVFPTKSLVRQAIDKLSSYIQNLAEIKENPPKVIYYYSGMSASERKEADEGLQSKIFDIFISTNRFLIDNIDQISSTSYQFLFVDDVDTALKSSKSAQAILKLLGFTPNDQDKIKETLKKYRENTQKNEQNEYIFEEIDKIRKDRLASKTVIFSSATLNRSNPILTSLVGFKPGSSVIYIRKVYDMYVKQPDKEQETFNLIKSLLHKLGDGGLIFVPVDKKQEYIKRLQSELSNEFNVAAITSTSATKIDDFANGEIDVLIGSATHYGILVRGLDLPWRVKYSIFVGIPKFKFRLGEKVNLLTLSRLLSLIALITKDQEVIYISRRVKDKIRRLSPAALTMLSVQAKEGKLEDNILLKAYDLLNKYLSNQNVLKRISEIGDFVLSPDNDILIPDYLTYVQASGRTSRIYAGDVTTGLSVLLVDDFNLFRLLNKKLQYILDDIQWRELDVEKWTAGDVEIKYLISKINEERNEISKLKNEGNVAPALQKVKTVLLVVESPNKAKTISSFFSRPSIRQIGNMRVYETVLGDKVLMVTASGGHVYDLTTQDMGIYGVDIMKQNSSLVFIPIYNSIKKCENNHQFTDFFESNKCPRCMTTKVRYDSLKSINVLRNLAVEADEVLIGTDPDTEGEKIAWDLYLALRPYNSNIRRAEFHEVTRKAILQAINQPREFNVNLVKSQLVRRIEDRWIGFKLSSILQTRFWPEYCKSLSSNKQLNCNENKNLSAGRVQTPVLSWIVGRYTEYQRNKSRVYYGKIDQLQDIVIYVPKQDGVRKNSKIVVVFNDINQLEEEFGPLPPYTTDTLLSESNNFFGLSAPETMRIAQDLFELGLITYHRTDSNRISNTGISVAENYLKDVLGNKYTNIFKPRSWGDGGAHEGIRPTKPIDVEQLRLLIEEGELELAKKLTNNHFKVYDIIFRRFISSQIIPLKVRKEIVKIELYGENKKEKINSNQNIIEVITGITLPGIDTEISKFAYVPVRNVSRSVAERLRELGRSIPAEFSIEISNSFIKSTVNLYTQADLVMEMKNKKIGRPSTYATIIGTILRRGYVLESLKTKKLIPTRLGVEVNKYLNENYGRFVSEDRTRKLLQLMDMVEAGQEKYEEVLKQVYEEINEIR
ncbi:reverse gyrase [Sulfolobus acidocaldarius SUSAZ]|nr:reverse gyrase [Sulfolobus acidocaldarius SUSAZ]